MTILTLKNPDNSNVLIPAARRFDFLEYRMINLIDFWSEIDIKCHEMLYNCS